MRALKVRMYQGTVCYKTPFSTKVSETYPLPPYSTIIGAMHMLLDAKEYIDMDVSVQGTHEGQFSDYATSMLVKNKKMTDITFMPYHRHMLNNVTILVHIKAEDSVLGALKEAIECKGMPFLGRSEDIVRVDSVEFVDVQKYTINDDIEDEDDLEDDEIDVYTLKNDVYVADESIQDTLRGGIYFRLNHHYTNSRKTWFKVNSKYVEKGNVLNQGNIYLDDDKDIVCFAVSDN